MELIVNTKKVYTERWGFPEDREKDSNKTRSGFIVKISAEERHLISWKTGSDGLLLTYHQKKRI